ncbi:MAG: prephenate dehydratase [Rikenellaceae bacterium]
MNLDILAANDIRDLSLREKRVAIQGYHGCFHQEAAQKYFGDNIEVVPCDTFAQVTSMVENLEVDAGVMAIENSIAGSILPNYRLLQNSSLQITGEVYISIVQNLMVLPGVAIEDIREVRSHPMAILQCLDFLEAEGAGRYSLIETLDTALSAKDIADNGWRESAAIASQCAAQMYGLEIVAENINTVKNNFTRFLILERADHVLPRMVINKASLYFEVEHKGGSLLSVLKCFELCGLNMTKLQSYPIPSDPFSYLFHMDVEFDRVEDFETSIRYASSNAKNLFIAGVYKKDTSYSSH